MTAAVKLDSRPTPKGTDKRGELTAKVLAAMKLNDLVEMRRVGQTELVAVPGMTQLKVSQVRSYKLQNMSLDRLM